MLGVLHFRYLTSVHHTQVASMLPHSKSIHAFSCNKAQVCATSCLMGQRWLISCFCLQIFDKKRQKKNRQSSGGWSHPDFGLYHFDTQLIQAKLGCNFWKAGRPQRSWNISFKYCGMMEASPDALYQACDVKPQSCRVCMGVFGTCSVLAACCTRWCIGMRCL